MIPEKWSIKMASSATEKWPIVAPITTLWIFCYPKSAHAAHSEDSGQTRRTPRLIRIFGGRIGHFVGFVMRRLNLSTYTSKFIPVCFSYLRQSFRITILYSTIDIYNQQKKG